MFLKVLSGTILFAALAGAVQAQEDIGKAVYEQYCATCHGVSGQGDGPLTEFLTSKVPDLTQLSARNDGAFPMLKVIHIIDGRTGLRAHGGDMPVYGNVFMAENKTTTKGDYSDVLTTRGRILSIAEYLDSIQK